MDEDECECEEGAPAWMATFSDMATLLLTFFVLLLSFANMDVENFKMALGSVKEAFGVNMEVKGDFAARSNDLIEFSDLPTSEMNPKESESYNEIEQLRKYIQDRNMSDHVEVASTESGVVLRVKDVALFATGSDTFTDESQPVLTLVEELFGKSSAILSVEGHTDNIPISQARFPSNWELSAARSAAVLRHYIEQGFDKGRLSIAGYGDLRPLAGNDTAEGRARNRRVEFVFKRSGKNQGRMFDLGVSEDENPTPTGLPDKVPSDNATAPNSPEKTRAEESPAKKVAPETGATVPSQSSADSKP